MSKKKWWFQIGSLLIALAFSLVLVSCESLSPSFSNKNIQATELPFPKGDYNSINWIDGQLIAMPTAQNRDNRLYFMVEGSEPPLERDLPLDLNCGHTFYNSYETRPDGRLEVWKECVSTSSTTTSLLAYDWKTGGLQEITGSVPLGTSQVSWNPAGDRGVAFLDSKFSSQTIFWIWNGGFGPMDLEIADQSHSWNAKDLYPDFPKAALVTSGNIERAIWSPDGKTIAFFASADAIGKTGFDRFYSEYRLFLMDATKLAPKSVFGQTYFPFILKWSPNSQAIAFIGQYGTFKTDGLWVYSLATNSVIGVATGKFQDILWTPGGDALITIACDQAACSKIEQFDLSGVLNP